MSIVLDSLVKQYAGHPVVNNVSLEVADGEFFVLLGPSGSGKSTVLRMISGLTSIDSGRVVLHGRDVTSESPQRRGVGFVFQHYALFRHMSVADNIEFALRVRKVPAAERRQRRDDLLEVVGLSGLGGRYPQQLSGGQQQRVALARALAHRPAVLLLDEPFGALDAPIRAELRRAVRTVQRELRITTIFVTHDQEEAFELADRVGVMNHGRLLEVAPPAELYLRPTSEFAAMFLGTANLLVGESDAEGIRVGPVHFPHAAHDESASTSPRVQVLFRPEDISLKRTREDLVWPMLGEGVVEETGFAGSFERLRLRIEGLAGVRSIAPPSPFGRNTLVIEAVRSQHQARRFPLAIGDRAWVGVRRVHTLTHPGLSILLASDGSPEARAALDLGAQIARLAHARVTLLAHGAPEERLRDEMQSARERIGSGLASVDARATSEDLAAAVAREVEGQHIDLVVHGFPARGGVEAAEGLLRAGAQNLLLVPAACPVPTRVLICVAVGEPGKEDVRFAARLVRHLGAQSTIMSVLPETATRVETAHAERFLAAGARSMALLGVPARTEIRSGTVQHAIQRELSSAQHDLLVVGAPLGNLRGEVSLDGLVKNLLVERIPCPVLIVRSRRS